MFRAHLEKVRPDKLAHIEAQAQTITTVPLLPVDDLSDFEVKRYSREHAYFNPGFPPTLATISRVRPLLEVSPDAERSEAFHIQARPSGLHIHIEGITRPNREQDVRTELEGFVEGAKLGQTRVSAADCIELTRQLSLTTPLV